MLLVRIVLAASMLALLAAGGCNSSVEPTSSQISVMSKYTSAQRALKPAGGSATMSVLTVDSITISRARIVISHIKFERENGECSEFKTEPFIFEPNLSGSVQEVAVFGVPHGTYEEVKFKIHHVDSSDLNGLSPSELAAFAEFLANGGYSMIIEGTVYRAGMAPATFRFTSSVDAEQEFELRPPLIISETDPVANVTLEVDASRWFKGSEGVLFDPTDPAVESQIDESLKSSIKIFSDDDRDGICDEDDHDD